MVLNVFRIAIFLLPTVKGTGRPSDSATHLKVSTPKDCNSTCTCKSR